MKPHCACLPLEAEKVLRCCNLTTDCTKGDIRTFDLIVVFVERNSRWFERANVCVADHTSERKVDAGNVQVNNGDWASM